ncbi:SusC/RagA family TonB-linked outer membrane protein [Flavobacterium sp.]|uniref:SusC/RagA family TonB-linked outer membrane protein n=1 Tax=Flavobacterium sp. TaxID=239 RepID=UPI0037517BDC
MKSKILLFALFLTSFVGFSQTNEISGKVIDATSNLPLPGVNVVIKNSTIGVVTDLDGNFKISKLSNDAVLIFSYVGYKTYQYKVTKNEKVVIKLTDEGKTLEEVVVVGYSTKKKKDVTGAVAVISAKTIEDLRPIKAEQALQGTVSGVVVSSSSGSPGAGFDIRIRGISTNGANGPLVLIDGYAGSMDLLNPSDIESLTVLKDAQAAVYGAIGANGVVLVTTKQGKKNSKTKVSFNSSTGFQETTKKMNLLNATEYALLLNESYSNAGLSNPFPVVSGLGDGTNWQNEVFQKAAIISNDISVSGGSDKVTYALSGSNIKQDGIIGLDKSGFNRSTLRLALGVDLSNKFTLRSNFIYTDFNRNSLSENGLGSVLFNAINTPSTLSVYDVNGNYTLVPAAQGFGNEVINPLAQIDNTYNDYNLKKLSGSIKLDYQVFKDLKLTSRIGFNSARSTAKSFSKQVDYGSLKVFNVTRSSVGQSAFNSGDYTFDLFAEYEKKIAQNHKVKLTVGSTAYEYTEKTLGGTGYDVPYNSWEFADISLAQGTGGLGVKDVYSYGGIYRRSSYFGTLDYDYKGKYLLSGIVRRDVSSRFGPENRVAYFTSILGGWVLSEEEFLKESKLIDFLKLRASYGTLGNDAIGDFRYRSLLNGEATYVFNNALSNGTANGVIANTKIQWEADKKFDVGLDLKILNNKIDITADYFDDTRAELLIQNVPVSGITGYNAPGSGAPTVNAGTVSNRGFELAVNYKTDLSNDLKLGLGFNATTLKNKVLEVNNGTGYVEGGSFGVGQSLRPTRMEVGQPIGVFYGYQTDGIFQNQAEVDAHPSQVALGAISVPGDIRYKDVNGDGIINASDRTYIGKPIADFTLGFNLNLTYKNFDIVAYTYASIGNDLIRNYERTEAKLNKLNYVLDRWTGEGTSNSVPRVTAGASTNSVFSDYFVEDASFVRIQNIQLGYSIKGKLMDKAGITKLRLYTSVNNVYTFTKYRGFDPAANSGDPISGGIDYGFYPTPRTFLIGLNANF